jgi:preprotein translocase subunit SecA
MKIFNRIFGTYSERQIKKLRKTADRIESLEPHYKAMSNAELRGMTEVFKGRLAAGETRDDLLPEAFAAAREAAMRVLGKRLFYVQLLGGIILHQGRIAEMKTGEGKTYVAILPAYLNALTGRGVHVVTVNEYLARYGRDEVGRVYEFMGLTTGLILHGQTPEEKREAYAADITYGTNNEFGFDYLRDNMVVYKEHMVQRGHIYAIVDEVDSILIDEARTPLIISGAGEESTDLYDRADSFVRTLRRHVIKELDTKVDYDDIDADYIVDEKARNAVLTKGGIRKAEAFFGLVNYADPENSTIAHHINQAIRAHGVMHRDEDYVVNENGVIIVDAFTGRLMPGRRYSDGLHQAIEAKEHVKIQKENKTLATITFQNYFRMYQKLAGMTGTALTEENEFREIYGLDVVEVPTNKPMIRTDHSDVVYKSAKGKYNAIVRQIIECHKKGQPVLVGTITIEKSELLSSMLRKQGIKHNVLNAKYHDKEAEIIAQAGKLGAVTISTNMAGRGTDIMLGGNPEFMAKAELRKLGYSEELIIGATSMSETDDPEILEARRVFRELHEKFKAGIEPEAEKIKELGGLFVLGTERHESRRIDNQLRGRAGRQGDPGESRFYISLEDDLMRLFGSERIMRVVDALGLDDDTPINAGILSNSIENAQKRIEDNNFKRRKNVLTYDDVMNQQRCVIYKQRQAVLEGEDISGTIRSMINATLRNAVQAYTLSDNPAEWNLDALRSQFFGFLCREEDFRYTEDELTRLKREDIENLLIRRAEEIYQEKEKLFGPDRLREVERIVLLRNVDRMWMDHIDAMEDLKDSIRFQAYAQRDPINEYRIVGAEMFDAMVEDIREQTVRTILSIKPIENRALRRVQIARPLGEGFEGNRAPKTIRTTTTPIRSAKRPGPNDPCSCGSGKKYKKCCGAGQSSAGG